MKPVWTLDEITDNLARWGTAWEADGPISYALYESRPPHLGSMPNFSPFSGVQRQALATVFDLISDIVPLDFARVADNGRQPGPGNERIAFHNLNGSQVPFWGSASIYQSEPEGEIPGIISGGDITINLFRANAQGGWEPGDSNVRKLMHEVLHTLGLAHPGEYNGDSAFNYEYEAEYRQDSIQYTVMSYWAAAATGADHSVGGGLSFAATPLLHDVAALQALYGANMETRTGDTIYGFGSNAGRAAFDLAVNTRPVFTIWDAGGEDTLNLSGYRSASRIDLNGGAFSDAGGLTRNISIAFGATIENAVGGRAADRIAGNAAANRLDGRQGADRLAGRDGDDTYIVNHAGDVVIETGAGGYDSIRSSVSYALGFGVEALALTGGAAAGTGNARANVLRGNAAANILDGGDRADTMAGRGGDDIYLVDHRLDRIFEGSAGGDDLVRSMVSYRLGAAVETLILLGDAVEGTGNAGANLIRGTARHNVLNGGAGADELRGGGGKDHYRIDDIGDRVIEFAGGGVDTIFSAIGFRLGAGVENLTLIGRASIQGIGNAANNRIAGNAESNSLVGALGDDRLSGGAGNDSLRGGPGADAFAFDTSLNRRNVDDILDFRPAEDTILLDRSIFTAIGRSGVLRADAFLVGDTASDAEDRILHDRATGEIFYDADGAGGAAAILFATVRPGTVLTHEDFSAYI